MLSQDNKKTKPATGFTLIELIVVVAIIGILAAVAWPLLVRYELKVSRADGIAGLGLAANAIENCGSRDGGDYTNCPLGNFASSPQNKYTIDLTDAGEGTYTLTADKNGGNADPDCGSFSLNNLGQQDITGSKTTKFCWSK